MANSGARYLVGHRRRFREHDPGTQFDAVLDPDQERRAIERGDITLIKRFPITLQRRSYRLPRGWDNPTKE